MDALATKSLMSGITLQRGRERKRGGVVGWGWGREREREGGQH